ncbi:anaphase-promoting complex, subunit 10 [Auriculariales sp. MPI-PUGE-AT-0066]|nr:anaphase-promoting complex, subunit 10 [Auriculariales sp. MPI-PUGE-AT-0066]
MSQSQPGPPQAVDPTIKIYSIGNFNTIAAGYTDISDLGTWTVSSYKFGFGAECLRDNDGGTFWHSDGPQPHFITVHFSRRMPVQKIALYLAFMSDDSYTPQSLQIRAGTGMNDLQDVRTVVLEKPTGWVLFDLSLEPDEEGEGYRPLYAYVVQVVVIENHMKGKDTHVRGMRVFGPPEHQKSEDDPFPFTTLKFKMYEGIR